MYISFIFGVTYIFCDFFLVARQITGMRRSVADRADEANEAKEADGVAVLWSLGALELPPPSTGNRPGGPPHKGNTNLVQKNPGFGAGISTF